MPSGRGRRGRRGRATTLGPRKPTEELVAALDNPSETVRLLALRNLGFKDDLASGVPVLVACLDNPSEEYARASRDVLSFYANRNPKALDLDLVNRLLNGEHASGVDHDEPGMRLVASLGKRGPESVGMADPSRRTGRPSGHPRRRRARGDGPAG